MIFSFVCFVIHFHGLILTFSYFNFHEIHINFQFIYFSTQTNSICHKSPVLTTPSIVLCTCQSLKPHTQRNDNSFGFDFFFSHTLHFRLCAKKADFSPFTLKRQGVQGVELQSKLNWMFVKQSPPPAL